MKDLSKHLINIKAINLNFENYFTWTSGIKSPIYIDNRLIWSFPKERKIIIKELSKLIKKEFKSVNRIFGTSTAGIIPAGLIASKLDLPCGYVRSSKKAHGKQEAIEGIINSGDNVLIIEDTISTGKSVIEVYEQLKEKNVNILGVVSIFNYDLNKSKELFAQYNIVSKSLINIDNIISNLKEEDKNKLKTFIDSISK